MNQTLKATVNAECTIKNHLPATYLSRPNPIPVRPGPEETTSAFHRVSSQMTSLNVLASSIKIVIPFHR